MNVIKNYLYNVSYQLLAIILPLITVPYVSGTLGAEGVGKYSLTYANTQYFIIFGMIGLALYGNRQIAYVRDDKEKLKETFYSIYKLQLITTTLSLVLFLIFTLVLNKGEYKLLYLAQSINVIASIFDISWLFMGLEEFKKTVVRNTIVKLLSLASIFIFVKSKEDLLLYVLILGISILLGNLSLWFYVPKEIGIKGIKTSGVFIHLKSSIILFIPQISIQIYVLLDRTLLGYFSGVTEVGYYSNAQKLAKIVMTIATSLGTVMMPRIANTIAEGDMEKVKYYIKNSFFFVSAISFPLMFGIMGISNELCPWFFTDEFNGIEKLVVLSSVVVIIIGWSNVLGTQLLVPMNRNKEFTISVTSGAIIDFVLNLFVLKYFGAAGACFTTIVAECAVTVIQFYYVRNFLSAKELLKPSLIFIPASLVMYCLVRFIGILMGAGIITNIVQSIAGVIVYFTIIEIIYRGIKKKSLLLICFSIIKGKNNVKETLL